MQTRRRVFQLLVSLAILAIGIRAQDASSPPAAAPTGVPVDRFEFRYGLLHPDLPAVDGLGDVTVSLIRSDGVWHAAGDQAAEVQVLTLGRIPEGSRFSGDALVAVTQALVGWFNTRGIFGVWAACTELESSGAGITDGRPAGDRTARIVVWASQVSELRSLARGSRFSPQESIDNPKHRRILAGSPLQPGANPGDFGSLFRKDLLEDYLHKLSMHPGRRVEASIASSGTPGKVVLDYLVTEAKPWQIFSQVTNTGTETTGQWRGRLGFQHNQLTNHDDILNIDAISTPDRKTYGGFLSYRLPLFRPARLLMRVYGSYGDFIANDVTLVGLRFAGRNWLSGVEFSNRATLGHGWELMSTLGANYVHYNIKSQISSFTLGHGSSNFLIPFFSPVIIRDAGWWSLSGALRLEHTLSGFANEDANNGIPALGRIGADAQWTSLRWDVNVSVFLDPWFKGGAAKADHLASEVSFHTRGRHLLSGRRLIPQEEEPIGGFFTVRGYPESVLAADEFFTASFEYAYHVPLALKPGEPGKLLGRPFKWRPPQRQQRPDWDLILRAFVDYGYRSVSPIPAVAGQSETPVAVQPLIDSNVSLAGAGVGAELTLRQNLSIRCDFGTALKELRDNSREPGQQVVVPQGNKKAYLIATFSW
jgi:hemolysin activation/secretion protein